MSLRKSRSGSELLSRANSTALKTMKSGIAKIESVSVHVNPSNNSNSVKVVFDAIDPDCEGHDEYFQTSQARWLDKAIGRLTYLFDHGNNDEAIELFSKLPDPFTDTLDAEGKAIVFKTNEELKQLRADYGENQDFLWLEDDSEQRQLVKVMDTKEYCDLVVKALTPLVGAKYFLQISPANENDNFQRVKAFKKASA